MWSKLVVFPLALYWQLSQLNFVQQGSSLYKHNMVKDISKHEIKALDSKVPPGISPTKNWKSYGLYGLKTKFDNLRFLTYINIPGRFGTQSLIWPNKIYFPSGGPLKPLGAREANWGPLRPNGGPWGQWGPWGPGGHWEPLEGPLWTPVATGGPEAPQRTPSGLSDFFMVSLTTCCLLNN